jgi:hypothetical protein
MNVPVVALLAVEVADTIRIDKERLIGVADRSETGDCAVGSNLLRSVPLELVSDVSLPAVSFRIIGAVSDPQRAVGRSQALCERSRR